MAPDLPAMVARGGIHALFGRSAQRLRSVETDGPCLLLLIGHARRGPLGIDETKLDPQTGRVVGHKYAGVMQIGNCCNQAKTEPVSGPVAAALEPIKSPQDVITFFERNSGTPVADRQNRPIGAAFDDDSDLALITAMFDRVVDQIGDCVEQEIAISDHVDCFPRSQLKPDAPFLRRGLEQLYDLANDFAQIDIAEGGRPVPRLDL